MWLFRKKTFTFKHLYLSLSLSLSIVLFVFISVRTRADGLIRDSFDLHCFPFLEKYAPKCRIFYFFSSGTPNGLLSKSKKG